MLRSRVIALGLGVAVLAQTACSSSISWPPRPGSCIEASIGKGRHAKWRYRLDGQRAPRASIEHVLAAASPRWQSSMRSSNALSIAGPTLVVTGQLTSIAGIWSAIGTKHLQFLTITLAGISMVAAGLAIVVNADDPFRRAVIEYNSHCQRPEDPSPSPPPPRPEPAPVPPPPPGSLPTLPSGSWTP